MAIEAKAQILNVTHDSAGSNLRSPKWEDVIDLYDDGEYLAIWGRYEGSLSLGVRWNGTNGKCGFSNQGENALWHVEPYFLARQILQTLLYRVISAPIQRRDEYVQNILSALRQS